MTPCTLAVDLDGTFLGGTQSDRQTLYRFILSHDIRLIFVTGRGLEAVIPLLSDPTMPTPDYIICDVGATVLEGESLTPVSSIQNQIDARWASEHAVEESLSGITGLTRQNIPHERRCSFFMQPLDYQSQKQQLTAIADALKCDLIYSAGTYLDFMPRGVNKGWALKALVEELGIGPDTVLSAGDTLNDLAMIQAGFKAVCVGNSEPELLEQTSKNSRVLQARADGAGGILEALSYFGFMGQRGIESADSKDSQSGSAELLVVYHRMPFEEHIEDGVKVLRTHRSPNGIIPTLKSFFNQDRKGLWVAWTINDPNNASFKRHIRVDPENLPNLKASLVPLTQHEVDIFYKQFSKNALWPILHTFWERAHFDEGHWEIFCSVNEKFADHIAQDAAKEATVWLHDYNLWMVPAYLRQIRPDLKIAFYHHTYFPSADAFNVLPWRKQVVGSLLQCDFIGFHIPRQLENFVDVARGVVPVEVLKTKACSPRFLSFGCAVGTPHMSTCIEASGRKVKLGAYPVGLDVSRIRDALSSTDWQQMSVKINQRYQDQKLMLSVERLDYTKGILARLDAFEKLLTNYPSYRGQVNLINICVPPAKQMSAYDELKHEIDQAVGRINGRFSTVSWTPVQFFFRPVEFKKLCAYYARADVMWVSPLRDGLNLTAKEYVTVQSLSDGTGVLLLSEFAGAAAELKGALLCNPHDPSEMSELANAALSMPPDEAQSKLKEMASVVTHYDIEHWSEALMSAV